VHATVRATERIQSMHAHCLSCWLLSAVVELIPGQDCCHPLAAQLRKLPKELHFPAPPCSALPHERGGASSQGSGKDGSTAAATRSTGLLGPLKLFWRQSVVLPLLSLSLLYSSVLTLGFLMTGYLVSPTVGLSEVEVSPGCAPFFLLQFSCAIAAHLS